MRWVSRRSIGNILLLWRLDNECLPGEDMLAGESNNTYTCINTVLFSRERQGGRKKKETTNHDLSPKRETEQAKANSAKPQISRQVIGWPYGYNHSLPHFHCRYHLDLWGVTRNALPVRWNPVSTLHQGISMRPLVLSLAHCFAKERFDIPRSCYPAFVQPQWSWLEHFLLPYHVARLSHCLASSPVDADVAIELQFKTSHTRCVVE